MAIDIDNDEMDDDEKPIWPRLTLRRTDQVVAAALTGASWVAIVVWCFWQARLGGRLIDIEQAEPIAVRFQINVNQADWPELAVLPNIGEQLAKRIVADREQNGPFRDLADLSRVRGIGPRTFESIEPFLMPVSGVESTAGTQASVRPQAVSE